MSRVTKLKTPITEADVLRLRVGDLVSISGTAYEIKAMPQYAKLQEHISKHGETPKELKNAVICHTFSSVNRGPKSASLNYFGFITSFGFNKFMPEVLRAFKNRAIIGKAGMGDAVLDALGEVHSVYLAGINGCSAYYTQQVRGIEIVLADIFPGGIVKYDFDGLSPLIVTMDSHGGSLHKQVEEQKRKMLAEMCPPK